MTHNLPNQEKTKRLLLVADYGDGDLAFAEVVQKLYEQARAKGVKLHIDTVSVDPFDAASTAAMVRAAVETDKYDVVYTNTAPRKDKKEERSDNEGEPLVYLYHCGVNGHATHVVGVFSGEDEKNTFAGLDARHVQLINCANDTSQFRSRDVFVAPVIDTLRNGQPDLKEEFKNVLPRVNRENFDTYTQKLPVVHATYDSNAGHTTLIIPSDASDDPKNLLYFSLNNPAYDIIKLKSKNENSRALEAGFAAAQLALNAEDTDNRSIIIQSHRGNFVPNYTARLQNGVLIETDDLKTLCYVKHHLKQVKEHNNFTECDVLLSDVPDVPRDLHVAYIDGYGNVKLSLSQDGAITHFNFPDIEDKFTAAKGSPTKQSVVAEIGQQKHEACIADGSFRVRDGELALSKGSSGWEGNRFAELFLRGGYAEQIFGMPAVGDGVQLSEPYVSMNIPTGYIRPQSKSASAGAQVRRA